MTSRKLSAISIASRPRRQLAVLRSVLPERVPRLRAAAGSRRAAHQHGSVALIKVTTTASTRQKPSNRRSGVAFILRGNCDASRCISSLVAGIERSNPAMPPSRDTTPASKSTDPTMRARVAPSALAHCQCVFLRELRTSCRCATFAQAISSSTPTAASHNHSDVRTLPVSESRRGTARSSTCA